MPVRASSEPTEDHVYRLVLPYQADASRWQCIATAALGIASTLAMVAVALAVNLQTLHASHASALEQLEQHTTNLDQQRVSIGCPPMPPPLMPAYPPGRKVPPAPPSPVFTAVDGVHDVAIVLFTRHGERYPTKDSVDLTPEGYVRANYMSKCITRQPSIALPLGAPTRLLASLRDDSKRPVETLTPLATKLGLTIETADMFDLYAVNRIIPTLVPGDQLLVSWQHWFLPRMIEVLNPPTPWWLRGFPKACNTSEWREPSYTRQGSDGDCYDIIWQLVLTRPKGNSEAAWQAVTFNQMHEGFGGAADSPCTEALSPIGKGLS